MAKKKTFENIISNLLGEPVSNMCHAFYDQYVEANVKFRSRAGMKTLIIRRQLGKCCKWCADLAGIYEYGDHPNDVFRRHDNCKCMVTYKDEDGYTDVWSKKKFQSQKEARLEKEKILNISSNLEKDLFSKSLPLRPDGSIINIYKQKYVGHFSVSKSNSNGRTLREELGYIHKDKIKEAVEYYKNVIRNKSVEHAIVIEQDGKVIHYKGVKDNVDLFDCNLDGAHVLHNHPISEGIVSFGEDDFVLYRGHQNAVYDLCNAIYDYHLEIIRDISTLDYNKIRSWVPTNINEIEETGEDLQHLVMESLREKGYCKYERRRAT